MKNKGENTFQKGYTQKELIDFVLSVLNKDGKKFNVEKIPLKYMKDKDSKITSIGVLISRIDKYSVGGQVARLGLSGGDSVTKTYDTSGMVGVVSSNDNIDDQVTTMMEEEKVIVPEKKPEAWEDEKFITYIKEVENAPLINEDKNFKHKSVEGGTDTIGFGHKLTQKELETGLVYGYDINNLNREAVENILKEDLKEKNKILTNLYGKKYTDLDYRRKQMLIDFQFNVKNFKDKNVFPKFKEALFAGDEVGMEKEYERYYTDKVGKMKSLARNKKFKDLFFVDKD